MYQQTIDEQGQLSDAEVTKLAAYHSRLPDVQARLREWYETESLPLLRLPKKDDVAAIEAVAQAIRAGSQSLVVLGTGGSSLGGQTLCALAENDFPIHFLDNVDPQTIAAFSAAQDWATTHVLMISKSGGTAETIAQALLLLAAMEAQCGREHVASHAHVVTIPQDSALMQLAQQYDIPTLEHDPNVGGRYSVLSLVGLIPAAVAGVDIAAIREGASVVMQSVLDDAQAIPLMGAAWQTALMESRPISVLMPYCDRLKLMGDWYQQLWAESLGKEGVGSTPVRALGATDQHSQVQLYLGGPKDKSFTFITLPHDGQGPVIDTRGIAGLDYLHGHSIGNVMAALQHGTIETMRRHHLPLRLIALEVLDAKVLGGLLMSFMIETIAAAQLLEIDAFDQPAVEEGKVIARARLQAVREAA